MKFLVIANCQARPIRTCLAARRGYRVETLEVNRTTAGLTPGYLARFDVIIAQDICPERKDLWQMVDTHPMVIRFPWLLFYGLTPDHCILSTPPGRPRRLLGNIPRIMAAAKARGLTRAQACALYNPAFIDAMGYRGDFAINRGMLIENLSAYTANAEALFERWFDHGVFFFTGNHPKLMVIEDVLRAVLAPHGIALPAARLAGFLPDPLEDQAIDPNLNHPRAHNLLERQDHVYKSGTRIIGLKEMVARTFRLLDDQPDMQVAEHGLERFDRACETWSGRARRPLRNPYSDRPAHTFWSKAVARPAPRDVRPGADLKPVITRETRVATAGSCFAQHVARAMVSDGLNYHVAEPAPEGMDPQQAQARGYGLFSARFGNIYSTRQLLQLIRRAYGRFTPVETAWKVETGYVDPFRPNIGEVFADAKAVQDARAAHLARVREMFETLDVFVFTLGLSEGWYDRRDGAAYPVAPGAVTEVGDPANFEFRNHGFGDIRRDLVAFLGELSGVNPGARVILTVSPVPLIATYTRQDALSATTWSKSVLRAVAGDVAATFGAVQYFPSYEIITGAFSRGGYFGEDLRTIRAQGIAHVMEVFRQRLVSNSKAGAGAGAEAGAGTDEPEAGPTDPADPADPGRADLADQMVREMYLICDEELLTR